MSVSKPQNYLKSAFVLAAMLSSTSAYAQFAGEWKINGVDSRFNQTENYVSGEIPGKGRLEGVVSPNKRVLRGTYVHSGNKKRYHFEIKLESRTKFRGSFVEEVKGFPGRGAPEGRWIGTQISRGIVAAGKSRGENYLRGQSAALRGWVGQMARLYPAAQSAASAANQNSTTSAAQNQSDTGVQGAWNITIKGTNYGPFADRKQAFTFSAPDRNGIVTGTSMGRDNVVFIGQLQDGRNRKLHGIWMEARRGQATGRWGLMEVRTSGEPATNMQARFSIGYRKPSGAYVGRAQGQPGMEATGPKIHSQQVRVPTVSQARAQWRRLIARGSPFPGIHGIWPTREIDAAIQPWIRGEKSNASFGGQAVVDPCAAKCMGKEPTSIEVTLLWLDGRKDLEANSEWAGVGSAAVSVVDSEGQVVKRSSAQKFFDIARADAVDDWRQRGVQPPPFFRSSPCYSPRSAGLRKGRKLPIPAGTWSDPLSDLKLNTQYKLIEVGVVKARDKEFYGASTTPTFKLALGAALENGTKIREREGPERFRDFAQQEFCMIDLEVADGKGYSYVKPKVRFEAVAP